jgi:hypothetical protein
MLSWTQGTLGLLRSGPEPMLAGKAGGSFWASFSREWSQEDAELVDGGRHGELLGGTNLEYQFAHVQDTISQTTTHMRNITTTNVITILMRVP